LREQTACPAHSNRLSPEPGRPFRRVYLRAAQAYMLISMPTGTSTIFGVFQLIRSSHMAWREVHAKVEPMASPRVAQVDKVDPQPHLQRS
jgi:hypothetical protein